MSELEPLIAREVERALAELEHRNPRALVDNPDGAALVADALRESIWLGLEAGCRLENCSVDELESDRGSAWEDWWRIREQMPEAESWPEFLAGSAPDVVREANDLAAAAGRELNLHWSAARGLCRAGAQAAEAGAALAHVLSHRIPTEGRLKEAVPAPAGGVQPDGTVRVAFAANRAEAELLQGALQTAGIPSTWKRTCGYYPDLLATDYREIYVPNDAADEARAVLATSVPPHDDEAPVEEEPPRKVASERATLRVAGRVTAALILLGWLWAVLAGLHIGLPLTLVLVAVLVAAIATMLGSRP